VILLGSRSFNVVIFLPIPAIGSKIDYPFKQSARDFSSRVSNGFYKNF